MEELRLRPHHLLCLQKYTGHGYDEAFTEYMDDLTACLKENPDKRIVLTEGCDDLCSHCPNRRDTVCESLEKTRLLDDKTLAFCGLMYRERGAWDVLKKRAFSNILSGKAFEEVCENCEWFMLCRNTDIMEE